MSNEHPGGRGLCQSVHGLARAVLGSRGVIDVCLRARMISFDVAPPMYVGVLQCRCRRIPPQRYWLFIGYEVRAPRPRAQGMLSPR